MESKVSYTLLGLFVIALVAAMVGVGAWLISDTSYRRFATYIAYVDESVSGLNKEAPVKYNGVDVGHVASLSINPLNRQQVKVVLKINADIPITESTTATMVSQGLTGLRFIQLAVGDIHAPLLKATATPFPVIQTTPSLMGRFDETISNMLKDFDNISDSLSAFLDKETTQAMQNSVAHIETITASMVQQMDSFKRSMDAAEALLSNSAKVSHDFERLVGLMQTTLVNIDGFTQSMQVAANDVASSAKLAQQTLLQVNETIAPGVATVVLSLNDLSAEFSELLQTLNRQPSVLVRGRVPAGRGIGE